MGEAKNMVAGAAESSHFGLQVGGKERTLGYP